MLVYIEGSISNKRIQNKTGQLVTINQIVVREMSNVRIISGEIEVTRDDVISHHTTAAMDEKQ